LIFFVDWGCDDESSVTEDVNETAGTQDTEQELETETIEQQDKECSEVECEECPECDNCPSCPSCPSCDSKTVIEGADELASTSLVTIEATSDRIINADNENFTYRLFNTKDYELNNNHAKLVVTIDDDNKETFFSEVFSLSSKQNKTFYIPADLNSRDEEYSARLTLYSANNKGLNKDVEFKVYNLNPDIEESKAFWKTNVVGFSDYELTESKLNLTIINNKNSDITLTFVKLGDKQWSINETLAAGEELEFIKTEDLCNPETYSLPVYMNYTSDGFEFEVTETQELVGYCG